MLFPEMCFEIFFVKKGSVAGGFIAIIDVIVYVMVTIMSKPGSVVVEGLSTALNGCAIVRHLGSSLGSHGRS